MAIADKLQNIINEKSKQKDVTNYGLPSASQIDNNTKFIEYPDYMYDAFLETLKSPETLWGNLPKVTGSGTSITLNDTTNTKMRMALSASETSQTGTPTPESPQAVHVISGDNTITISNGNNSLSQQKNLNLGNIECCKIGNYEDEFIRTSGKNLFDASYYSNVSLYTKQGLYYAVIEMPDSFKTKFYGKMSLKGSSQNLVFGFNDSTSSISANNRILNGGTLQNVSYDFTNATNVYLIIGNGSGVTLATDIPKIFDNYNIMISYEDIPYEPYGTNEWYIKKNVTKIVLDGTEANWNTSSLVVSGYKSFYITNTDIINDTTGKSSHFQLGTFQDWSNLRADNFFEFAQGSMGFRIDETLASDLNTFKTWLGTNNVSVYRTMKNPTYTKITGTLAYQVEDVYNNSFAYDGQTNITQANNDLPFIINAEIPSGFIKNFTRLNYIQSSATQYLSISDFYPTNNTRIKTSFDGLSNTMTTWAFGARQGNKNKEFGFHASSGYVDCYGNDRQTLKEHNLSSGLTLHKDKTTSVINSEYTLTHTANTFTAPCPLNIFALNNNGSQGVAPSALKMYYFEIYESDVLIHNLIPAKRKSDNEIGMYDLVSGTFYTNQGTGSFLGE